MKPEVDHTLRVLAGQLMTEIAPSLADLYTRSNVEMIGVMLIQAAEEYDRAAEIRFEENREMRVIFRNASRAMADRDLAARLEAVAGETEPSLRVSALNETNDRLRRLLIELHTFVEGRDETWAREIEREIWRALRASAARRALSFFPG